MNNLINIFEAQQTQDVKTFNTIFTETPIEGYPANTSVEIKGIYSQGRLIIVGQDAIYMPIQQYATKQPKKQAKQQYTPVLPKAEKNNKKLPGIYGILKPSQFMIYSAIKELGSVGGIEELSEQLSIDRKTISKNLKELSKLKLIRTEKVSIEGKSVLKLSVDIS
jgi:hypothetical protein